MQRSLFSVRISYKILRAWLTDLVGQLKKCRSRFIPRQRRKSSFLFVFTCSIPPDPRVSLYMQDENTLLPATILYDRNSTEERKSSRTTLYQSTRKGESISQKRRITCAAFKTEVDTSERHEGAVFGRSGRRMRQFDEP